MANMIVHSTLIRLIRVGAFNAFSGLKTLTGNNYPLGNSIILDLGSTYNIGNTRLYFNP